ncbi:type II secretion system F family protein [Candidatus Pacearchaeota archaeon]|nr:type II secretion system F family protein [Candidatus Pacearchaeota archaeon]
MIEQLKSNIENEIKIVGEISKYINLMEGASPMQRKLLESSIDSLRASIKIMNDSLPEMVGSLSLAQKLPTENKVVNKTSLEKITFVGESREFTAIVKSEDKARFLKELNITEEALKKIEKTKMKVKQDNRDFQRSRAYVKISNLFFQKTAFNMVARGKFRDLSLELRKSNLNMLLESYVSIMLFSTLLSLTLSIIILIIIIFADFSLSAPLAKFALENAGSDLIKSFWIIIVIPLAVFGAIYYYPSSEKKNLEKRIDQELPFAVIHMSAISGSGIEPTYIFKIIGLGNEYPYLRKEIRKVLNQLNLYGYDLVTALNNVSRSTSSSKLSELFSGLSTTISSGGDLSEFLEKRAETLLVAYRLEREKFTRIAETFMDIYITVAIAAPMILLLILVMLSINNFSIGLSPESMTLVIIAVVGLINVVFLSMLNIKQPSY